MNDRAYDLTVTLRAILGTLPGATSISLHAFGGWAIVLITASSDEVVTTLGEELGLGASEVKRANGRWWRRVASEREQGSLRVEVAGPHHMGPPPRDDAGEASL
jgi:hypothetical protein